MQHTADDDAECQRDENLPGETETGHAHRGPPCVDQLATYRKFALVDANRAVSCADTFATLALSSALHSSHPCTCSRPLRSAASRRSEEHTSEFQSIMHISYAVLFLTKK